MLIGPQRGAVLATSLIILVVMTLLVLSMLRTSVLELKIGGGAYTADQNFSNAEVALEKFVNDNNGRFAADCLTVAGVASCFCTNPDSTQCQASDVGGNDTSYQAPSGNTPAKLIIAGNALDGAQQTVITASQLSACVADAGRGSGNQLIAAGSIGIRAVYFNIGAESTGALAGTATVNQGIKSFCQ